MNRNALEENEFSDSDCSGNSTSSNESSISASSESVNISTKNQFESTKITAEIINLPKALCQDPAIFAEFFSLETWHGLSDAIRKHLCSYLPMFTDNIEFEKNSTIEALFTNRIRRFGRCPLQKLQKELSEGNCKPDISTLNRSIAKATRREQRFQENERLGKMARKLAISRELLLRKACRKKTPSFTALSPVSNHKNHMNKTSFYTSTNMLRAKKRYFQEIRMAADQLNLSDVYSDEENFSDVVHNHLPRRQRRLYGSIQGGSGSPGADVRIVNTLGFKDSQTTTGYLVGPNGKIYISEHHYRDLLISHKRRKIYEPDHVEMDCEDIKLKDVVFRTQASSGYRRIMPLPKIMLNEDNNPSRCKSNTIKSVTSDMGNSTHLLTSVDNEMPQQEGSIQMNETQDELNSDESVSMNHSVESAHFNNTESEQLIRRTRLTSDTEFIEEPTGTTDQRNVYDSYGTDSMPRFEMLQTDENSAKLTLTAIDTVGQADTNIVDLPTINNSADENKRHVPITDSETIRTNEDELMPTIETNTTRYSTQPKSKNDMSDGVMDNSKTTNASAVESTAYDKSMSELMQETHKCFLSLIRDMFCSTPDHRLTIHELKIKLNMWLNSPIAALNDWYQYVDDKWDDMLQSAILFLSGEFSDQPDDFVPYIEYKIQLNIYQWIGASRDSDHRLQDLCQYWLSRRYDMGVKTQNKSSKVLAPKQKHLVPTAASSNSCIDESDECSERAISPPRFPTDWSVRKATDSEVNDFREQEKLRYENPHMAFTYKHKAYNSVVGPVKGIYTQVPGISKARGHNMLVADRPNFVTILTLVRDATARLPNGEGTRADICELLKSSQYISPTATDQVLQTIVSGALDRMHTEHDPCVKYDTKRKIWIYLHRNRTEEEFERLHHQYQGIAKHKKTLYRKSKSKETFVVTPRKATSVPNIKSTSQSSLESESALSDTNIFEVSKNVSKIVRIESSGVSGKHQESLKKLPVDSSSISTELPHSSDSHSNAETPRTISENNPISQSINTAKSCEKSQLSVIPDGVDAGSQQSHINIPRSTTSVTKKVGSTITAESIVLNTISSMASSSTTVPGTIPLRLPTPIGLNDTTEQVGKSFIVPVTLNSDAMTKVNSAPPLANIPSQLKSTSLLHPKKSSSLSTTPQMQDSKQQEMNKQSTKVIPVSVCSTNPMPTTSGAVILRTDNLSGASTAESTIKPVNSPKGQQAVLTPVQQKQILQNLLAQQHRQVLSSKSIVLGQAQPASVAMVSSANIVATTSQAGSSLKSMKPMQKIPALTLSPAVTPPAVLQAISSGMTNPHVIQIKSSNSIIGATSGTKIQPIITTIKDHVIGKYTQQQQSIPKSLNIASNDATEDRAKTISTNTLTKSTTLFVQSAAADATVARVLKSSTVVQPSTTGIVRTSLANAINVNQSAQQVMAKVVKNLGDGHIVSLDNILSRQRVSSDMTLRLAEPKHLKAQLIQLSADSSGLPIAQYAMVSQNKNIIPTSSQCTISTSKLNNSAESKVAHIIGSNNSTIVNTSSNLSNVHKGVPVSGLNILHKTCNSSPPLQGSQLTMKQPVGVQQMCTKIAGTNKVIQGKARSGTNFITSSPINITTLGTNPLIIASKPATAARSDVVRQTNSNVILHNTTTTLDSSSIVYGRPATVYVQGNLLAQGHVNLINAQQGSNSPNTQKIVLSNQLVKVRAMPRQQHVQFSFTQQPSVNPVINTVATASTGVLKSTPTVLDQQSKPLLNNAPKTTATLTTPAKIPQKVGIRLNPQPQRMVLAGGQLVTTQQILVQPGVQSGPFNIKRLKVIPVNNNPKEQAMRPNIAGIQCKITSSTPNNTSKCNEVVGDATRKLFQVYSNNATTNTGDNLDTNTETNN